MLCSVSWGLDYKKDIETMECVQRIREGGREGSRAQDYEEQLRELGWFSLEKRKLGGNLIALNNSLKGG